MYKIVRKKQLNSQMTLMNIEAPFVAKKAQAGQFIMLRVNETGERIPLTIADYDREAGWVQIIFQKVGKTTMLLDALNEGDSIIDLVGPLGKPTEHDGVTRAAVIGGGAGCAIAYPQAKSMKEKGISTYKLVNTYGISRSLLDRLKHNKPITTVTINDLCHILSCKVEDILIFIPDTPSTPSPKE